ncbi:MAG: tannase/feruloyl esterase family alpha/beta hydrolase [Steroidobacteraceae bacterium]
MKRLSLCGSILAAWSANFAFAAPAPPSPGAAACAALGNGPAFAQTQVASAAVVLAANGLPAYCEVQGVIRADKGSQIGVVYRLPENWNRKLLALGGGGWMGNTTLQAAGEGLKRGYATLQTDAGHTTGSGFDAAPWAIQADGSANKPKLEDFSHRAIHLMTARGKDVIKAYFGAAASRAYYQGCSTGGRMGLMEVQRYPEDFDGVIAGAPVYTLQTQTSAQLRALAFAAPGARLLPQHLTLVTKAVLAACDAKDGAADGVLRDPRACNFNPAVLACTGGQAADSCLTAPQIAALRKVYAGEKMKSGAVAAYPLDMGGETGWARFVAATAAGDPGTNSGGMHALRGPLLGDSNFDMNTFTAETVGKVRNSWLADVYEAKQTNITPFVRRGGKLILWHGFSDPGPSARGTIEYYDAARKATPRSADALRLFLAPGVAHCGGGSGPDRINWLEALENWVEKNQAPEQLPATKTDSSLAWNVCAYPKLPTGQAGGTYACK